jgi:hypothetical protein|nr:MAG TPA: hypothetical protein [Caudoviricetes sp.]
MANQKYFNIFVLSFLDRIEGIEHDLSYLKKSVKDMDSIESVEEALHILKDKIKQLQHDNNFLRER